jgi:hypothetical protein
MLESNQEPENKFTNTDPEYWVERWEENDINFFHKEVKHP